MPINTWRGRCCVCQKKVGERKGWAAKSAAGNWQVWHQTCAPAPGKTEAELAIEARRKARLPYAD